MSLVPGVNNPAIDNLVQSSLESENAYSRLEWIPCSDITDIEPTQVDNVYYTTYHHYMLVCLGNSGECTQTLVSEFARIYSLPTHKHDNDVSQFRRYSKWLDRRNSMIYGFTKYDNNYYMVAGR